MTTKEFAAVVRNGTLNGKTVLVDGAIERVDMMSGYPCGLPPDVCLIGQLVGTDAPIYVYAQRIPITGPHGTYDDASGTWQYWSTPESSVSGRLAFLIDTGANPHLVGQVRMNGDNSVWAEPDAATVDVDSVDIGEVLLVDGWLTGIDRPLFCPAPRHPRLEGLPSNDWCNNGAWLTNEAAQLNPSSFSIPTDAIRVQSGAFDEYAPQPGLRDDHEVVPQHAIYAISRRLFGGGRSETPPFWSWAVVGRLGS